MLAMAFLIAATCSIGVVSLAEAASSAASPHAAAASKHVHTGGHTSGAHALRSARAHAVSTRAVGVKSPHSNQGLAEVPPVVGFDPFLVKLLAVLLVVLGAIITSGNRHRAREHAHAEF